MNFVTHTHTLTHSFTGTYNVQHILLATCMPLMIIFTALISFHLLFLFLQSLVLLTPLSLVVASLWFLFFRLLA